MFLKDSMKYLCLICFLGDTIKRANLSHIYWNGYKLVVLFKIGIASPSVRARLSIIAILENYFMGAVFTRQGKMPNAGVQKY